MSFSYPTVVNIGLEGVIHRFTFFFAISLFRSSFRTSRGHKVSPPLPLAPVRVLGFYRRVQRSRWSLILVEFCYLTLSRFSAHHFLPPKVLTHSKGALVTLKTATSALKSCGCPSRPPPSPCNCSGCQDRALQRVHRQLGALRSVCRGVRPAVGGRCPSGTAHSFGGAVGQCNDCGERLGSELLVFCRAGAAAYIFS